MNHELPLIFPGSLLHTPYIGYLGRARNTREGISGFLLTALLPELQQLEVSHSSISSVSASPL